ncbi:MAG: hypothetical protein C5B55_13460 [Blastocatellia bacterium]|nr:MAG: hypothetical protein C5B55_13460 [Blastocatellia bacterium]
MMSSILQPEKLGEMTVLYANAVFESTNQMKNLRHPGKKWLTTPTSMGESKPRLPPLGKILI